MKKCERCGKEIDDRATMYCNDCTMELLDIMRWQNAQKSQIDVICPWCGHIHELSYTWQFDLGRYNETCQACGKPFTLRVEPIYIAEKPESMYKKGE